MRGLLRAARHAPLPLQGRCYGALDAPPGEDPALSAARLIASLPGHPPREVWSSPLARCRAVAALLAERWGARLCVDERLREIDHGAWEGRAWEEIERTDGPALRAWMDGWRDVAPPGGEALPAFAARVEAWRRDLPAPAEAALVAHAGVVRALLALAGAPWEEALARPVPHLTWLEVEL